VVSKKGYGLQTKKKAGDSVKTVTNKRGEKVTVVDRAAGRRVKINKASGLKTVLGKKAEGQPKRNVIKKVRYVNAQNATNPYNLSDYYTDEMGNKVKVRP
jgi:anaerobic glycerol-3-phosphate dehydrogenase